MREPSSGIPRTNRLFTALVLLRTSDTDLSLQIATDVTAKPYWVTSPRYTPNDIFMPVILFMARCI